MQRESTSGADNRQQLSTSAPFEDDLETVRLFYDIARLTSQVRPRSLIWDIIMSGRFCSTATR